MCRCLADRSRARPFVCDKRSGILKLLQRTPSYYAKPDNLVFSKDRRYLFAVHHGTRGRITKVDRKNSGEIVSRSAFGDNGIAMFALKADGEIDQLLDIAPSEEGAKIPSIMH